MQELPPPALQPLGSGFGMVCCSARLCTRAVSCSARSAAACHRHGQPASKISQAAAALATPTPGPGAAVAGTRPRQPEPLPAAVAGRLLPGAGSGPRLHQHQLWAVRAWAGGASFQVQAQEAAASAVERRAVGHRRARVGGTTAPCIGPTAACAAPIQPAQHPCRPQRSRARPHRLLGPRRSDRRHSWGSRAIPQPGAPGGAPLRHLRARPAAPAGRYAPLHPIAAREWTDRQQRRVDWGSGAAQALSSRPPAATARRAQRRRRGPRPAACFAPRMRPPAPPGLPHDPHTAWKCAGREAGSGKWVAGPQSAVGAPRPPRSGGTPPAAWQSKQKGYALTARLRPLGHDVNVSVTSAGFEPAPFRMRGLTEGTSAARGWAG